MNKKSRNSKLEFGLIKTEQPPTENGRGLIYVRFFEEQSG